MQNEKKSKIQIQCWSKTVLLVICNIAQDDLIQNMVELPSYKKYIKISEGWHICIVPWLISYIYTVYISLYYINIIYMKE